MRLLTRSLCMLAAFVTLCGPAMAQREELPTRPTRGPTEVTADVSRAFTTSWRREGSPSIVVIIGQEVNGRVRYDVRSNLLDQMAASVASLLLDARATVEHLPAKRLEEEDVMDSLQRNLGGELTGEQLKLFQDRFAADLVFDIRLTKAERREGEQTFKPTFQVRDNRNGGTLICTDTLTPLRASAERMKVREWSVAMTNIFMKRFTTYASDPKMMIIRLIGIQDGVFNATVFDDLILAIEDAAIQEIGYVGGNYDSAKDVAAGELEVEFTGNQRRVRRRIETTVLPAMGLTWSIMTQRDLRTIAIITKDEKPTWYALTDPTDPDGGGDIERLVRHILRLDGKPSLGILVGADIEDRYGAFEDESWDDGGAIGFTDESLAIDMRQRFTDVGFRVLDNATLRQNQALAGDIADRYENRAGLLEAMKDNLDVDLLVMVNRAGTREDAAYNVELIDRRTAEFIGGLTLSGQSKKSFTKPEYRVNMENPESVGRYVSGELLDRWKRFMVDANGNRRERVERLVEVEVYNVDEFERLNAIISAFKELKSASGQHAISGINMSTPYATFQVAYTGTADDLKLEMFEALSRLDFPVRFNPSHGHTVRIDLHSGLPAETEIAERVANVANAGIKQAAQDARDSIGVIVSATSESTGFGTVWTVDDNLLATNSHVAKTVNKAIEWARLQGREPLVEVYMGGDYSRRLKIGKVWMHPVWEREGTFVTDVALIEVVEGDAGQPLKLATAEQLADLDQMDDLALIGFPLDGVPPTRDVDDVTDIVTLLPVLQVYTGTIASITDKDNRTTNSATDRVLCYSAAGRPGSSGSPLIGPAGTVIGLHAGVSVAGETSGVSGGTVLVGSGFGYGPTVDVLKKLIEDTQ